MILTGTDMSLSETYCNALENCPYQKSGVYARSVYFCNYIYKPNLFLPLQYIGGMKANTLLRSTMYNLVLIPDLTSLFIVKDGT